MKAFFRGHRLSPVSGCVYCPLSNNRVPKNFTLSLADVLVGLYCNMYELSSLASVMCPFWFWGSSGTKKQRNSFRKWKLFHRACDFGGTTWGKICGRDLHSSHAGVDLGFPYPHTMITPLFGGRREDSFTDFVCLTWSQVINLQIVAVITPPGLSKWTSLSLFLAGKLHFICTF